MGSHPWQSQTTYGPDIAAVVARHQREVVARGEFGYRHNAIRELRESLQWLPSDASPRTRASLERQLAKAEALPKPTATTIEQARDEGAESGTYSILDAYQLCDIPEPAACAPIDSEELEDVLGTATPSLDLLYERIGFFLDDLRRGSVAYVVCYSDGEPSDIVFFGMSFD